MCPNPWRVPTQQDFEQLASNINADDLISAWGYGGFAIGSSMYVVDLQAYYWSSTVYSGGSSDAYYLYFDTSGSLGVGNDDKYGGLQVRCVR
jgi:hypothetical protein